MGWASYLEDICTRFDDNGHQSNAMVGPAGSGEKRISPELKARFTRLKNMVNKTGGDLIDFYQREHLDRLSSEMDEVHETLLKFQTLTLLASNADVMKTAADLEKRSARVIQRAGWVRNALDQLLRPLLEEMTRITQLLKRQGISFALAEHSDLVRDVMQLDRGNTSLWKQHQALVGASERFQLNLAGELLKRIVDSGQLAIPSGTAK